VLKINLIRFESENSLTAYRKKSRNCNEQDIHVFNYPGVHNEFSYGMEQTVKSSPQLYRATANPMARQYKFASGQAKKYSDSDPLPPICLEWLARQIIVETDRDRPLEYLKYYVEYMGELKICYFGCCGRRLFQ
jgi:hypothetical protein